MNKKLIIIIPQLQEEVGLMSLWKSQTTSSQQGDRMESSVLDL